MSGVLRRPGEFSSALAAVFFSMMRAAHWTIAVLGLLISPAAGAQTPSPPSIDSALPPYSPRLAVDGDIHCTGGSTMQDLAEDWARLFRQHHPRATVRIGHDTSLSAEGFTALMEGRVNCVTFVREPFAAELAAFRSKFGYAPQVVNVAGGSYATKGGTHAIAIYVNATNPLRRVTLKQLDAIFSKTRRRGGEVEITRWGQLGLGGEWTNRPIHVYTMLRRRDTANPPGIMNYLEQRMLGGGEFRDDVREQRDTPGEQSLAAIVNRIAADPNGIGFSGFGYAVAGAKSLALAESDAGPFYAGRPHEVASRNYPLSRQIYLMVNREPGKPLTPVLLEFLMLALSREGQQAAANNPVQFIPLSAAQAAAARSKLD